MIAGAELKTIEVCFYLFIRFYPKYFICIWNAKAGWLIYYNSYLVLPRLSCPPVPAVAAVAGHWHAAMISGKCDICVWRQLYLAADSVADVGGRRVPL